MNRLENKIAIVTGLTSGIGIGIAKLYAAEGAQVIVCGRRVEKGQGVVDSITEAGGKASFHAMDITDTASIEKLVEDTVQTYGRIDVLVNNAANVALKDGRVDELSIEMWDAIFQSDMRGTFYITKCALPHMIKNGGGSIQHIPAPKRELICSQSRSRCSTASRISAATAYVRVLSLLPITKRRSRRRSRISL